MNGWTINPCFLITRSGINIFVHIVRFILYSKASQPVGHLIVLSQYCVFVVLPIDLASSKPISVHNKQRFHVNVLFGIQILSFI